MMLRTHTCGEINKKYIGKEITLAGWVHTRRDHGELIFIDMRDAYGLTQIVFDPKEDRSLHDRAPVSCRRPTSSETFWGKSFDIICTSGLAGCGR